MNEMKECCAFGMRMLSLSRRRQNLALVRGPIAPRLWDASTGLPPKQTRNTDLVPRIRIVTLPDLVQEPIRCVRLVFRVPTRGQMTDWPLLKNWARVQFVVTASGPFEKDFFEQTFCGLFLVTEPNNSTTLDCLLIVLTGSLLLRVPLQAVRLGLRLQNLRVLLQVNSKLATILLSTSRILDDR